jgi:hypothetical protein
MKARYGFSSQGSAAMKKEIRRQIAEQEDKYIKGIDTMFLWALHVEFGFGKKRLERAYKAIGREYEQMRKFFETDEVFPAEYKLKEIGIDMEKLRNEVE